MTILVILLLLVLLFFFIRFLYDRFWDRGVSCKVTFQQEYAIEDDVAALNEVIVNDKFLPLPVVEIDFHMDKRLQFAQGQNTSVSDRTYRRDVFSLSVRQQITRTLDFKCVGRGFFRITESGMTAKDLFLTRQYIASHPQNTEFYVLPRPVPTQQIQIPFSRIMGAVLSRKKVYDDPFEFAGLRDYSRGDPMKYINWKATARTGEMLTNLHESTLSQKVILLLDMEGKGLLQSDLLNEYGVRVACSLGERLLRAGVELGVYSNGMDVQTGAPLRLDSVSGTSNILYLKKKFACVQADNGLAPVTDCFPRAKNPGGEEELLVLVTHNQRHELIEAFSEAVGKGRGVLAIPYREEHEEIPAPKNMDIVWLEA